MLFLIIPYVSGCGGSEIQRLENAGNTIDGSSISKSLNSADKYKSSKQCLYSKVTYTYLFNEIEAIVSCSKSSLKVNKQFSYVDDEMRKDISASDPLLIRIIPDGGSHWVVANAACHAIPPSFIFGDGSFKRAIDFNILDPDGKNNYQRLFEYMKNKVGNLIPTYFNKSLTIHSKEVSSNRNNIISIGICEFTPLASSKEASPFPLIGSVFEILVTDPLNRRTGYDYSIRGKIRGTPDPRLLQEIPNSTYEDGNVINESRFLRIWEPLSGDYTMKIIGTQKCRFGGRIWVTDQNNNSVDIDINGGIISPGEIQSFKVTYDSSNANNFKLKKVVDSGQLESSLQTAFDLNWIDNKGILNSLTQKIERAESAVAKGRIDTAIANLKAFINEVKAQKGKHIKSQVADILIYDARSYIKQLSNNDNGGNDDKDDHHDGNDDGHGHDGDDNHHDDNGHNDNCHQH